MMLSRIMICLLVIHVSLFLEIHGYIFFKYGNGPNMKNVKQYYGNELPLIPFNVRVETKTREAIKLIYQKLDHFNKSDTRQWKMRYFVHNFLPEGGDGPLFVHVGGEGESSMHYSYYGHFRDLAKKYNAYYITTEHRYYGESHPTEDLSMESLKYLDSKQAVADLAYLIQTLKSAVAGITKAKVIVCGGSYAGRLAIQLKGVYRGLVDGVWASSAPLLAQKKLSALRTNVGHAILTFGGEPCYQRIKTAIAKIEDMLSSQNYRPEEVQKNFNLCIHDFRENALDFWILYLIIANSFSWLDDEIDVKTACEEIMAPEDDVIGLGNHFKRRYNYSDCLQVSYREYIQLLTDINNFKLYRQWFYQTCYEFGWFAVSDPNQDLFGKKVSMGIFEAMCKDAFGKDLTDLKIDNNVLKTNLYFANHLDLTNVYMTVGEYDPWRPVVALSSYNVTILPGVFHCTDLDPISPRDSPEMRASKEKIDQLIGQWIQKF